MKKLDWQFVSDRALDLAIVLTSSAVWVAVLALLYVILSRFSI